MNATLRRSLVDCLNPSVGVGTYDPALHWTAFSVDDFSDLGTAPVFLPTAGCTPTKVPATGSGALIAMSLLIALGAVTILRR